MPGLYEVEKLDLREGGEGWTNIGADMLRAESNFRNVASVKLREGNKRDEG